MNQVLYILLDGLILAGQFFWQALWALLLGFMISGAIQAFVSREKMVTYLGDASLSSVGWAMAFGTASTSCSFGDIAATKTLFRKGAHIIPAVAFLIASTNLVIGLSFVIWVLLGWEVVLAEAVGAPIFIFYACTMMYLFVPDDWVETARQNLIETEEPVVVDPVCKMRIERENGVKLEHKNQKLFFCSKGCRKLFEQNPDEFRENWTVKITSWNGWVEAANQTRKDFLMLWKELFIGFLLAGLIAAAVPDRTWATLFEGGGTGFVKILYNAFLGPLISLSTFVGSVGNVPLASVLMKAGMSFAGVIAFIYADLIVPQLIGIYRKVFGKKMGTVLSIVLYASMALTGITVYYLFSWTGVI